MERKTRLLSTEKAVAGTNSAAPKSKAKDLVRRGSVMVRKENNLRDGRQKRKEMES